MDVSVNHVADVHAGLGCNAKIRLNLLDGVAHGGQVLTTSAKDVGRCHHCLCMQELTQDHQYTSVGNQWSRIRRLCAGSLPTAMGNPWACQSCTLSSSL